jgi:hypothetical protein
MASCTIQIPDPFFYDQFNPGDQVYLISWFNELEGGKNFKIQREIPVTNMSGEERAMGWLGCTNNINKSALGLHEIESMKMLSRRAADGVTDEVGVKFVLSVVAP